MSLAIFAMLFHRTAITRLSMNVLKIVELKKIQSNDINSVITRHRNRYVGEYSSRSLGERVDTC